MKELSLLVFSVLCLRSFSQDTSKLVAYTPDYKFNDGVYMSFEDFKNNHPTYGLITRDAINKEVLENSGAFFCIRDILYVDSTTNRVEEMGTDDIWGICINGVPYLHKGSSLNASFFYIRKGCFFKIRSIGNFCYIVKTVKMPAATMGFGPQGFINMSMVPSEYSQYKINNFQYILELYSGTLFRYSDLYIHDVLKDMDPELFQEFDEAWSQQRREGLGFYYITKYNEKHPLYLPKN